MFNVIQTFLVREDLEISKLTYLFHFFAMYFVLSFFFFGRGWFITMNCFSLDSVMYFVKSLLQYSSMFELIGNLVPQIGEVVGSEGPLNLVFFFAMIPKKSRIKLFIDDIAVFWRYEIDVLGCFLGVLMAIISIVFHLYNELMLVYNYCNQLLLKLIKKSQSSTWESHLSSSLMAISLFFSCSALFQHGSTSSFVILSQKKH